ncbi:MAG: helix-turn-helix transcriptional regulator [Lachnospiraceae bacterium]|nr:helix-turn-helix transcriptional regulator [Lachnospiraceae bacterium]
MKTTIDQNIRALRKARNMRQEQLAEALDVSTGAVSKWERGAAIPELKYIMEMADIFGISTDVLIGYRVQDGSSDALEKQLLNLQQEKNYEEGILQAEQALKRYPNRFSIVYRCGELYMVNGVENHDKKSLKRAIELLSHSLLLLEQNTDPQITEFTIQTELAQCYIVLEQQDKGLEILKKYNEGGIHNSLIGLTYAISGKHDAEEALPYLVGAFSSSITTQIRTLIGFANYYSQKQDWEAALDSLLWLASYLESLKTDREAITYIDKMFGVLYTNCANYAALSGRPQKARFYLEKAFFSARDYDAAPVTSTCGLRFLPAETADTTLYDDIGPSALMAAEMQLAIPDFSETLQPIWNEIKNQEI